MTQEEKAISFETLKHIRQVTTLLNKIIVELLFRADIHDQSKLEEPELSTFLKYTPKLADSIYGSEEYNSFLKSMSSALEHHYSHNRHHPEYFKNASKEKSYIDSMNLIDIIEMLCDWKAASMRHKEGDIMRSIAINKERFGISDQLESILKNTVSLFCDCDENT